jgi:hypothetical protein
MVSDAPVTVTVITVGSGVPDESVIAEEPCGGWTVTTRAVSLVLAWMVLVITWVSCSPGTVIVTTLLVGGIAGIV